MGRLSTPLTLELLGGAQPKSFRAVYREAGGETQAWPGPGPDWDPWVSSS